MRPSWSVSGWDFSGVDDLGVLVDNMGTGGQGFFGGNIKGVTDYLVPYWKDVKGALTDINDCGDDCWNDLPRTLNNDRTFETETDIYAAYLMAYFDFSTLGVPVRGNFGIRHIETERSTEAFTESDLLEGGEQLSSADFDFDHTLPSLKTTVVMPCIKLLTVACVLRSS